MLPIVGGGVTLKTMAANGGVGASESNFTNLDNI